LGRNTDLRPLGNIIEFHGLSPNPNDLDFTWHEQCRVRPCPAWDKPRRMSFYPAGFEKDTRGSAMRV